MKLSKLSSPKTFLKSFFKSAFKSSSKNSSKSTKSNKGKSFESTKKKLVNPEVNKALHKNILAARSQKIFYQILSLGILCLAVSLFFLPNLQDQNDFEINFIDIGQGDCILVRSENANILIDGGGTPGNPSKVGEEVVLPYLKSLGILELDMVVNTHPDNDHIGGLFAVLEEVSVKQLVVYDNYPDNELYQNLITQATNKEIPIVYAAAGDVFDFEDFTATVVSPPEGNEYVSGYTNDGSIVMQISYGEFDFLSTGDLDGPEQYNVAKNIDTSEIEVLQLPHHGSKNSYSVAWYETFDPIAVGISVGIDNTYGHPSEDVVSYWENRGVEVFRTDLDGSFKIIVNDGEVSYATVAGSY